MKLDKLFNWLRCLYLVGIVYRLITKGYILHDMYAPEDGVMFWVPMILLIFISIGFFGHHIIQCVLFISKGQNQWIKHLSKLGIALSALGLFTWGTNIIFSILNFNAELMPSYMWSWTLWLLLAAVTAYDILYSPKWENFKFKD